MKKEQILSVGSSGETDAGRDLGPGWAPGVAELLDYLALELALEYVRLMEQAAETEASTADKSGEED